MLKAAFWSLVAVFLLIMAIFFFPAVRKLFQGPPFLAVFASFFLLSLALIFLTLKKKVKGRLKKFLLLMGGSALGLFVSAFLHNMIYALFIYLFGQGFWERIGLGDEPFFFFLAIFVCPIGFLIGMIGSAVLFIKRKTRKKT